MYSIISNNCYGTNYHKLQNIEYKTPFIGLYIKAPCYINLLENFDEYIKLDLIEIINSKYGEVSHPIGLLGTSEIHFLHYKNFEEAKIKWDSRKTRLQPFKECIVKICDRGKFNRDVLKRFIKLNHPSKLLFMSLKWNNSSDNIIKIYNKNDFNKEKYDDFTKLNYVNKKITTYY